MDSGYYQQSGHQPHPQSGGEPHQQPGGLPYQQPGGPPFHQPGMPPQTQPSGGPPNRTGLLIAIGIVAVALLGVIAFFVIADSPTGDQIRDDVSERFREKPSPSDSSGAYCATERNTLRTAQEAHMTQFGNYATSVDELMETHLRGEPAGHEIRDPDPEVGDPGIVPIPGGDCDES